MEDTKKSILDGEVEPLSQLVSCYFTEAQDDLRFTLSHVGRKKLVQLILSADLVDLEEKHADGLINRLESQVDKFPASFKASLTFNYTVIQTLQSRNQLLPVLKRKFERFDVVLLAFCIQEDNFLTSNHPYLSLYNYIYSSLLGWTDEFGDISESQQLAVEEVLDKVDEIKLPSKALIQSVHGSYQKATESILDKSLKLAQRVTQSESGQIKNKISQQVVTSFVNSITKGKRLPSSMGDFLLGELVNESKLLVYRKGVSSKEWLRLKKLLQTLLELFQVKPDSQDVKKNELLLESFSSEFSGFINETLPRSKGLEGFLLEIEKGLKSILSGKAVANMGHIKQLEIDVSGAPIEKITSSNLVDRVRQFTEGDWFAFKDQETGKSSRLRLQAMMEDFNMLIFCNFSGKKERSCSYDDFAYLISAGHAVPLLNCGVVTRVFSDVIDRMLESYQSKLEYRNSEIARLKQERAIEEEQQKRALAARKAAEEAKALKEEKAANKQKALMQKMANELKVQARLALDSLRLGTWVEFVHDAEKGSLHCKLAVKMARTHRFVFVDEDGATVAEYERDELVKFLLTKKLLLKDTDVNFSEKLSELLSDIKKAKAS